MKERWERVTSLFVAARNLDGAERDSFLGFACKGDEGLRSEIEKLLAADIRDDSFLQNAPWKLTPSFVATLESGQLLKNRYRIDSELGVGGQAVVFRATDELLERPVVIKVMRAEGRTNQLLKSRFEHEMRALASIDHPGVIGIVDVGELEDSSPFLVIEYIPGVSLRQALTGDRMSSARIAAIVQQMASALKAAHSAGVSHRDLKPENVMLHSRIDNEETVKLIDFGIAKIGLDEMAPKTTTMMIAGTVRYMAPEQFEGRHSSASDIYSMALVVCEMLGGHPDIRALPRSAPRKTRKLLEKALAYRPGERPSDVSNWANELAMSLNTLEKRPVRLAGAVAAILTVIAASVAARHWARELEDPVHIIENVGATDPVAEGFQIDHDVTGRIVINDARTGYDGWRILTHDQGQYYRPFTTSQKRRALARGWSATAVMKLEAGFGGIVVDFSGEGRRYDVQVTRDGDVEYVRLNRQVSPFTQGAEFTQSPPGMYHKYEIIYDPQRKTADLWVDNERRLRGYEGHSQFQENKGLIFWGAVFKSDSGSISFKSVRFAISR